MKLAGLDVILVHRMLKNAVPVTEYLLVSEALFHAAGGPRQGSWRRIEEELAGLGPALLYFGDLAELTAPAPVEIAATRLAEARENLGVVCRTLPYLFGVKRPRFAASARRVA